LTLEIVTPDGVALQEDGVEVVVLHRREPHFEVGSEIAIFPLHAPLLVRLPVAPVRYRKGVETVHLAVGAGFSEVVGDRVVIVTSRCERVPPTDPDPRASAEVLCDRWGRDLPKELTAAASVAWADP
jgi:F0F1-type ATP synthase epsilon subunit